MATIDVFMLRRLFVMKRCNRSQISSSFKADIGVGALKEDLL